MKQPSKAVAKKAQKNNQRDSNDLQMRHQVPANEASLEAGHERVQFYTRYMRVR